MTARRLPPLSFPFALLGVLLAHLTMTVLQTGLLDPGAHWIGLGISGIVGLLTGWGVPKLRRGRAGSGFAITAVLGAGAVVGMAMQLLLLLREPPNRSYMLSSDLTTQEPVSWVLVGAPVGAIPALLLVLVYLVATHLYATGFNRAGSPLHAPSEDAWERIMAPFAGAAGLLGGLSCLISVGSLRIVAGGIVVLAGLASLEILVRDRARSKWLARVLSGRDPEHEIVPLSPGSQHVPLAVGTTPAEAVVVRVLQDAQYRSAAREPILHVSATWESVTAPLQRRRRNLVVAHLCSLVLLGVGAFELTTPGNAYSPCELSHCGGQPL